MMWDKTFEEKPAFKNVIGVSVYMPISFNASVIYECRIIGDTFEMIMRFAQFSNLRSSILLLSTVIIGQRLIMLLIILKLMK